MKKSTLKLMDEYEREYSKYDALTQKFELLVKEILESNNLMFHSVSGRTKNRKSLEKKIESKTRGYYKFLNEITDLSGIRIITYFSDDVDRVADAILKEFDVDLEASVDKRTQHGSNAFGYMSLHFIASVTNDRCKFSEYKRFKGLSAEIQIRSVLQHAWAEIEHDLGYKSEGAIPRPLRRRFSRLASLLELGDDEFVTIRNLLSQYQETVTKELLVSPQDIEIDKVSLSSFIQSKFIQSLDNEFVKATNSVFVYDKDHPDYQSETESSAEFNIPRLEFLGIKNIGELEQEIEAMKDEIPSFAKKWLELIVKSHSAPDDDSDNELSIRKFPNGITLFYFVLLKMVKTCDKDQIRKYWIDVANLDEEHVEENTNLLINMKDF